LEKFPKSPLPQDVEIQLQEEKGKKKERKKAVFKYSIFNK